MTLTVSKAIEFLEQHGYSVRSHSEGDSIWCVPPNDPEGYVVTDRVEGLELGDEVFIKHERYVVEDVHISKMLVKKSPR